MKYHLIGICGTGMGALAGLLKLRGHEVRGSDAAVYPPMSEQLATQDITVYDGYAPSNLAWEPDVVIVGNTCRKDHIEVAAAKEKDIPLRSMPDTLGSEFLESRHAIVVSGTHGKTTTTSLITHILRNAGRDPGWFVGGVLIGLRNGYGLGAGEEFVVEGDEYDSAFFDKGSKFLHYRPKTAVLTSVEFDHADIFDSMDAVRETFTKLIELIPQEGLLVVSHSNQEAMRLARKVAKCTVESYAIEGKFSAEEQPTWVAKDIEQMRTGRARFTVEKNGKRFDQFECLMVGQHNTENLLAAIAVADSRGISAADIRRAVSEFAGIRRRQEIRGIAQGVYVLDDYAHHPTAVRETIGALRQRFPRRRILVAFEPRSTTSRHHVFQHDYVDALVDADLVVIGRLHDPSRIPEEKRLDPEKLSADIHARGTRAQYFEETDEIVTYLAKQVHPGDVVAIMSSGAFDHLHDKLLHALGDAVMPARIADLLAIREILTQQNLITEGLDQDSVDNFLVLRNETGFVGCVGLEVFGEEAILRSLAVKQGARGVGYGWLLADTVISQARYRGVKRLYLLTESAADFFAEKHGFHLIDPSTVGSGIENSRTFKAEIERDAKAMRLDL